MVIIAIGALLTERAYFSNSLESSQKTIITSIYDGDTAMWNHLFGQKPEGAFPSAPAGVILPHHMIVAEELAKTYQKLARIMQPSLIVIISPNHYENGTSPVQTCTSCEYHTIQGTPIINAKLSKKLIRDGIATEEPTTFANEHGVHAHTPFIKNFFPSATILPITLKWETSPETTIQLSEWLDTNIPADALVIASVDFSHYIPVEHANFHDVSSYATIKNFDYQNIYDLEIDSPPSISTITHLMEKRGYMQVERFAHTNNQQFRATPLEETTSHQFMSFLKGEKQPEKSFTILATGNIPEDQKQNDDGTRLGFYSDYRWNIHWEKDMMKPDSTKLNPWLKNFRGKEDRMIVGADAVIFDLKSQTGADSKADSKAEPCQRRTQNEIHISFCALETSSEGLANDLQKWTIAMQNEQALHGPGRSIFISLDDSKHPIPDSEWKRISHDLIDHTGAAIIIGKNSFKKSPVTTAEHYSKSTIIRSLGDFITSPAVPVSSGSIAKIVITKPGIEARLYPVDITNGHPRLRQK